MSNLTYLKQFSPPGQQIRKTTYEDQYTNTIDDFISANEFVRLSIVRERDLNRTIVNLYIKHPWFLKMEFSGKETDLIHKVSTEMKNSNKTGSAREKEKNKSVDSNIISVPEKPLKSTLKLTLIDFSKQISCIDPKVVKFAEDEQLAGNFLWETTYQQFKLPRRNHAVKIEINYASVNSQLQDFPDLVVDLKELMGI